MISRIGVAVMAICLVLYLVVAGQQAVLFFRTGEPIAIAMGVALVVLPVLGGWALVRELMFGFSADRLGRVLEGEGAMPEAETELTNSGRMTRSDAGPIVQRYSEAADQQPQNWRDQYRLGVVQDAAGMRKDARASIRRAIALEKQTRASAA